MIKTSTKLQGGRCHKPIRSSKCMSETTSRHYKSLSFSGDSLTDVHVHEGQNLYTINSLAPGKFEWNFRHVIFKQIWVIDGWGISCEIALIWMSLDFTDDQSTLVQVMAWCRQATSYYLSQCWPRSLSPYGITRPQWVKDCPETNCITQYQHLMVGWSK